MNERKMKIGARLCALFAAAVFFAAMAFIIPAREAGAGAAFRDGGAAALMMRAPEPTSPDVKE
jgi:hypothetical protein